MKIPKRKREPRGAEPKFMQTEAPVASAWSNARRDQARPRLLPAPGHHFLICPGCGLQQVRAMPGVDDKPPMYRCLSKRTRCYGPSYSTKDKGMPTYMKACRWKRYENMLNRRERLILMASSVS